MADLDRTRNDAQGQLWDILGDVRAGMLGVEGHSSHMQPMAHFPDRENGKLWFFSKRDTDLVQKLGTERHAHYCIFGNNHDYHACLRGALKESGDLGQVDRMWNSIVDAWFEDGKNDPKLTLLEFNLSDGMVWASLSNPILFGWEIAKARVKGDQPEVGVSRAISFK